MYSKGMSKSPSRPWTVSTKDHFVSTTTTYRQAQKVAAKLIATKPQTVFIDGPGKAVIAFQNDTLGITYL